MPKRDLLMWISGQCRRIGCIGNREEIAMRQDRRNSPNIIPGFDPILVFWPAKPCAFFAIAKPDHTSRESMRDINLAITRQDIDI